MLGMALATLPASGKLELIEVEGLKGCGRRRVGSKQHATCLQGS